MKLVRQTDTQLLEGGRSMATLAQQAHQALEQATQLRASTRERVVSDLRPAQAAHPQIRTPSRRLTQGQRLSHWTIVHASDPPMAPLLTGQRHGPTQFGRKPGSISEPTAGLIVATRVPGGHPSDSSSGLPWVDKVPSAIERSTAPLRRSLQSVAGALGGNAPGLRQALHARGRLSVGIPQTVEPLNPQPSPEEILDLLHEAGLNRQRTPHQVPLACACGDSRPVLESHIASVLWRGAGQMRYKGPQGAVVQLGRTVMAHNGAAVVRICQQRLSKRAQKFRRWLGLRRRHVNQIHRSKN